MLQNIHDKVKGWFANLVMGILAVAFALWGIEFYLGRNSNTNEIARVNGTSITDNQLNNAYERLKQNLQLQNKSVISLTLDQQAALKKQVLQQLIQNQALADAANQMGVHATQPQIDNLILQLPAFQVNGSFSQDRFQQVLAELGYTQEQFVADMSRTLLVNQVQMGLQNSSFVMPNEVKQLAQMMEQQRDLRYTIISAAQFLPNIKVPDSAIQSYYQQHQEDFRTPEKVQIAYIELNADDLKKQVAVSDQDLQQYYQSNLANFVKAGKQLPFDAVKNEISAQLINQKTQQLFSEQSQKLSDLTYTNAGSLDIAAKSLGLPVQSTDYFTRTGEKTGLLSNPQVLSTAFNEDVLKNSNNSNVIPIGDKAVIVLRAKNYQPSAILPLANVKNNIVQQLQQQMARDQAKQKGEAILQAARSGQNLTALSQQNHLNWQANQNVNRQSAGLDMQILRAAFSLPKDTPQNQPNIAGTSLANGDFAIIDVTQIKDAVANNITPAQLTVIQNELENSYAQLDYQSYVDYVLKHAKIKFAN